MPFGILGSARASSKDDTTIGLPAAGGCNMQNGLALTAAGSFFFGCVTVIRSLVIYDTFKLVFFSGRLVEQVMRLLLAAR